MAEFPFNAITQTKFWMRIFEELKRVMVFEKTNIGATVMVVTKSECIVFNFVAMLDGVP